MRSFAALALFAAPCGCVEQSEKTAGSTLVNDPEHIQRINEANEERLWVAGPSKFFDGKTFDDAKMLLGARLSHIDDHLNETVGEEHFRIADDQVPADFDAREQWKGLIHPIRDQAQCGSCWAFSASEVLSDRYAISKNAPSPVLSPEDLVGCDRGDHGCDGGYLSHAWAYLTKTGIVTDTCMPYVSGGGRVPKCPLACAGQEEFKRYKAQNSYAIKGPVHMQKEIVQHGPIQVGFMVYGSFMNYQSGIYHKLKSETQPEGGHAVKIVGYGVENGKKYWTVANSWNTDWGEEGFFRILRGHNQCGMEKMGPPYAGLPAPESDIVVI